MRATWIAAVLAALGAAGCGDSAPPLPAAGSGPATGTRSSPAISLHLSQSTGIAPVLPPAARAAQQSGGSPGSRTGPAGVAQGSGGGPAAALTGARPGTYLVDLTTTNSMDNTSSSCSARHEVAGAPATGAAGTLQDISLSDCKDRPIINSVAFPTGGGLSLVRSRSAGSGQCPGGGAQTFVLDPDHPLELVPGRLAAGVTFGPDRFTAPGLSATGTLSGQVGAAGQDGVGGTAVPIWAVEDDITLDHATICGFTVSATIRQLGHWAPSLNLFTRSEQMITVKAFGTSVSVDTTTTLTTATPA